MPDPLNWIQDDGHDQLQAVLQDGDTIRDLTGLGTSEINVCIVNAQTRASVIDRNIDTIGVPAAGEVNVTLTAGELTTLGIGTFLVYFVVTPAAGQPKTYPNRKDVWVLIIQEK